MAALIPSSNSRTAATVNRVAYIYLCSAAMLQIRRLISEDSRFSESIYDVLATPKSLLRILTLSQKVAP